MKRLAFLAMLLVLAPMPAAAQRSSDGLGSVLGDLLGGIFGVGGGRVHGHVVLTRGDTLVVRTDDGRTLAADVSSTDPRIRGLLKPGDGVTLTLRQPRDGEARKDTLVASDLQLDPPSQAGKTWSRVEGIVQEAGRSSVTFKTREGFTLPLDVAAIQGLPALQRGEPATLIFEHGGRQGVVAIWIEPGAGAPAASVDTSRGEAGDVQRVRGRVESVTLGGFTMASDDGRTLTVDTGRMPAGARRDVRPGDLVTVFGRPADRPGTIVAEFVH